MAPAFSAGWRWAQLSHRHQHSSVPASPKPRSFLACSFPPRPGEGLAEEWALPCPPTFHPHISPSVCGPWQEFAGTGAKNPPVWCFWLCLWPRVVEWGGVVLSITVGISGGLAQTERWTDAWTDRQKSSQEIPGKKRKSFELASLGSEYPTGTSVLFYLPPVNPPSTGL